jgi:hypothetical protein
MNTASTADFRTVIFTKPSPDRMTERSEAL